MPVGVEQAKYIKGLTQALGRTDVSRVRHELKTKAGIYPYKGRERDALEYFIVKQKIDLRRYTPIEDDAKRYHAHAYGDVSHKPLTQLALPSLSEDEPYRVWDRRLVTRLAKLITDARDETHAKMRVRQILHEGGYPKPTKGTWTDEERALKIFKEAGISIAGFVRGSASTGSRLPAVRPQHKLEVQQLQTDLEELTTRSRKTELRMRKAESVLNQSIAKAYSALDTRRRLDPHARLSDAELWADVAHRELIGEEG